MRKRCNKIKVEETITTEVEGVALTTIEGAEVATSEVAEVDKETNMDKIMVLRDKAFSQGHAHSGLSANTFIRSKDAKTFTVRMRHMVPNNYLQSRSSMS